VALSLFGVLYFWQFPHAMAIAWLARDELAAARLRVATVIDPSGRLAARVATAGALALLPASLVPAWLGPAGGRYALCALVLGAGYLAAALHFRRRIDERSARIMLRASLVYLPALLVALILAVRL
jgi:protoheme IX farnesyltransferase